MKILSIYAGPRTGQNTDQLLSQYLKGLQDDSDEVNAVRLGSLKISPCNACMACNTNGNCIIRDDMQGLYNELDQADVVILATPFYFNSVSALAKIMIDRCQKYWAEIVLLKKKEARKKLGILLVTAGSKEKNQERMGAELVAKLFFLAIGAAFTEFIFIDQTDAFPLTQRQEMLMAIERQGKELREKVKESLQVSQNT